ncbi:MAG TPA: formate dehydrogenase accessory sulfurtransferase FdhD [Rhodanobacteraceae bacterium]|nr:formate dehydrogenase accessory sulfurtransferase FdhD [Rhodanobacteraceae bacterium]
MVADKRQARTPPDASEGLRRVDMLHVAPGNLERHADRVIAEAPVALVYNGVPFAVMMATPCDLEDFALGFALAEGIVESPGEFELVDTLRTDQGISLQGLIPSHRFAALGERHRNLAGRSGCGLCGVESLEEAVRPPPVVTGGPSITVAAVAAGIQAMAGAQPLNAISGGAHAAGFVAGDGRVTVREDVGRHNALDKLIGALASAADSRVDRGFLAITSRASWEIVHKAAHAGIAIVAAISAPTSLAISAAEAAGITLIGFAREEAMNVYTHARRIA